MEHYLDKYFRKVSGEEFTEWPDGERIRWIEEGARNYLLSTTREERIAHYRAKQGENVKYYDTYGWPEHF